MPRLSLIALSILLGCLTLGGSQAFADCVSCGPNGDCYTASAGFSANCECKIRSLNGVATCKPSGICDPNDPTSCDSNSFPQVIGTRVHIATPFLNDLAEVSPLLAGGVWAGISEANSGLKSDRAEVKGTMGKEGKSYTYLSRVRLQADGSIALTVRVEEDGTGRVQDYEGTVAGNGKSGRFAQLGPKGKALVYSWGDTH